MVQRRVGTRFRGCNKWVTIDGALMIVPRYVIELDYLYVDLLPSVLLLKIDVDS